MNTRIKLAVAVLLVALSATVVFSNSLLSMTTDDGPYGWAWVPNYGGGGVEKNGTRSDGIFGSSAKSDSIFATGSWTLVSGFVPPEGGEAILYHDTTSCKTGAASADSTEIIVQVLSYDKNDRLISTVNVDTIFGADDAGGGGEAVANQYWIPFYNSGMFGTKYDIKLLGGARNDTSYINGLYLGVRYRLGLDKNK